MMFRQRGFLAPVPSPQLAPVTLQLLHKRGYRLSTFEWLKCKETATRNVRALAALHSWPQ